MHSNWQHHFLIHFQIIPSNFEAQDLRKYVQSFFLQLFSDLRTGHTSSNWWYYMLLSIRPAGSIRIDVNQNTDCVLLELKIRCDVCFLVWYIPLIFSCESNSYIYGLKSIYRCQTSIIFKQSDYFFPQFKLSDK